MVSIDTMRKENMAETDQIKCPLCGKGLLQDAVQDYKTTVREGSHYKEITIQKLEVELCSNCKEVFLPKESLDKVRSERHQIRGLLSPFELKKLRQDLGLTQTKMSVLLGTGIKSYLRWEKGTSLQSKSMDRYIRLLGVHPGNVNFLKKLTEM